MRQSQKAKNQLDAILAAAIERTDDARLRLWLEQMAKAETIELSPTPDKAGGAK